MPSLASAYVDIQASMNSRFSSFGSLDIIFSAGFNLFSASIQYLYCSFSVLHSPDTRLALVSILATYFIPDVRDLTFVPLFHFFDF